MKKMYGSSVECTREGYAYYIIESKHEYEISSNHKFHVRHSKAIIFKSF